MLERLITWSLNHRMMVLGGSALIVVIGVVSLRSLNVDAFPDTTPVQIQINTVAPALVPEEIERQITFPVELAMGGMPGLEALRSVSQFGISNVIVTFRDGTNIFLARQLVNERLASVEMPPGLDRPEMGPISTGLGEVFHYLVTNDDQDLMEAKTFHDWTVKPAMRSVPGVAEINSWGGLKKQYQVRLDPNRLAKYDLTFNQVTEAIPKNNLNVGGGNLKQGGDTFVVHGVGRTTSIPEIENIVITATNGVPVRVKDVAEVLISHEMRRGIITANGEGEAVLGLGYMLMGENSYQVTSDLRDRFETVRETLPPGMHMDVVYDRTQLVSRVIETVKKNLFEGAYLVIVILYLLLGNLRAGLIAAASIPLSMMVGFTGMAQAGIAASLLSLGAIDFGVVVDSSVVVIENIMRRLAHHGPVVGKERLKIIRDAAVEVRTPTVFGQVIIMIVYLPILTLEGVEGKMFRPMALTVIFILIGSLLLSLTLTPVLSSFFLPKHVKEEDVWIVKALRWVYAPLLNLMLKFRWIVLVGAAIILAVTLKFALGLGSEFIPRLSEGDLVIGIIRAPGTSLEESADMNTRIEKLLLAKFPDEISHLWSRVGTPEVSTDAGSVEATDLFVSLKPREQWKQARTQSQLVPLLQKEIDDIKGQITWFTQPIEQRINEMVSGVRADVALKLFGEDFDTLIPKGQELYKALASVQGVADLASEQVLGQPILRIEVDQDAIARYGVPAQVVLDLVESVGNKSLGEVVEGQLRFPLVVRLPDDMRKDPEAIGANVVSGPNGERIPLSRLAKISLISGPKMITREWGKRRVTVQCNVRGRDVGSFVAEAQRKIAETVALPPDQFRIEWGGQFENMQRAQKRLSIVVPLALCLILLLLYLTYRDVIDMGLLFLSVPFACVGGVAALMLRELPLSISAAVGFITLSGVSVLNSMVLVSALRLRFRPDEPFLPILRESSLECLRTIAMTALVASVGFVPMAVSEGSGAEVQRPLATVVIGGVMTSTLFTLLVLPALYAIRGTAKVELPPGEAESGHEPPYKPSAHPEPVTQLVGS
ncbi:efflux RND transporter permease subunit [Planctomicrobium piriforme]|uniref:Cobalt-zinc-cadmium resistance protein CzcA n=1 Tax=Planctomicrobium piriforme TaxID=1576369 RepID=A0A1I3J8L7_9PLAN|nr:CusA/CzcA family heavy metal efflux RND transporter [Planctomicrobium piriforme]SFI56500.1 cobalt-zinc-cadmium resistance protein CzcA [Planctomicrobium piriforme]